MTIAARPASQTKRNQSEFWNSRQAAAPDERALAAVLYDLARSTAKAASGGDPDHPVWRSLTETLHTWATDVQRTHGT